MLTVSICCSCATAYTACVIYHAKSHHCQKSTAPCAKVASEASYVDLSARQASDTADGAATWNGHDVINLPMYADKSAKCWR